MQLLQMLVPLFCQPRSSMVSICRLDIPMRASNHVFRCQARLSHKMRSHPRNFFGLCSSAWLHPLDINRVIMQANA